MYSWVVHGIESTRNSVDTEFPLWHGIPLLTWKSPSTRNSPVDTEFPHQHGIPLLTRNSPVDTEFPHQHGIPLLTQNSADTEFCIYFFTSVYSVCYAMLFIFRPNSDGIPYSKIRSILWNSVEFCGFQEPVSTICMKLSILSVNL
jgi:hypothetical protein